MLERLLIVGLGSIGRRHLQVARMLLPNASIAVLRHRSCGDEVDSGIDHCFTRLEAALAFEPQAAVVATPATHHLDSAIPLARAGVHLLVEKPLAASVEGVPELIAASQTARTVLRVGYNLRFSPSLRRFRDAIRSDTIGQCLCVCSEVGQFLPSWRLGRDYRQAVSARRELGGGVLLELSHELDYLRWIFGEAEWVQATLRTQSRLEIDVEDCARLTLGFKPVADGRQLLIGVGMDFVRQDPVRQCTAVGENGTLRWDGLQGTVELFRAGGNGWAEIFRSRPEPNETYCAEWQDFITAIAGGEGAAASGSDGLRVLEIVEAARLSESSGGGRQPVNLAPEGS